LQVACVRAIPIRFMCFTVACSAVMSDRRNLKFGTHSPQLFFALSWIALPKSYNDAQNHPKGSAAVCGACADFLSHLGGLFGERYGVGR
jgi:hypothetical protein